MFVNEGWQTAESPTELKPGRWYQAAIVNRLGSTELWLNGKFAGAIKLREPMVSTTAPLTFGGVNDAGVIRQAFVGALSSARLQDRALFQGMNCKVNTRLIPKPLKSLLRRN